MDAGADGLCDPYRAAPTDGKDGGWEVSAHDGYETFLGRLTEETASPPPRVVQRQDGTKAVDPHRTSERGFSGEVDTLFGASRSYVAYKKEKPEHRLILWYRLQGYSVKETATLSGYTPQTVSNVCGQPWFQDAFVHLSEEMGKDVVKTFLEGEILPAFERTANLARSAESEAVRLAANKELMDRYLGKPTVHVDQKVQGKIDTVVHDIAKLREEERRLTEELRTLTGAN
jgi:hypothetical protein